MDDKPNVVTETETADKVENEEKIEKAMGNEIPNEIQAAEKADSPGEKASNEQEREKDTGEDTSDEDDAKEATEAETEQRETTSVKKESPDKLKTTGRSDMDVDVPESDKPKDGGDVADKKPQKPTEDAESSETPAPAKGGGGGGAGDDNDDDDDGGGGGGDDDVDDDDDDGDNDDKDDKDHNPEEHADDDDDDDDDDDQMVASATDSGRRSSGEQATPRRSTRKRRRPATEPEVETATPRRLRPRSSSKPATTTPSLSVRRSSPARSTSTAAPSTTNAPPSPRAKPIALAPTAATGARDVGSLGESAPRPIDGPNGKVMRIGDVLLVTYNQLSEEKQGKLAHKKVAPIEQLRFQDICKYNRDQLRSYCVVYNIPRGKKTEMEAYMARFVCWWNNGEGDFALSKYEPTKGSNVRLFNPDGLLRKMVENPSTKIRKSHDAKPAASPSASTATGLVAGAAQPAVAAAAAAEQTSLAAAAALLRRSSGRVAQQPVPAPSAAAMNGVHPKHVPAAVANAVAAAPAAATPATARPRPTAGPAATTRGAATSFKQKVHARQAGAKFKAAYNGAGPAVVNIVENSSAYFEGRDAPEVIRDQAKSYARYQFNVDQLTEIFDGPLRDVGPADTEADAKASNDGDGDVRMGDDAAPSQPQKKGALSPEQEAVLLRDVARNAVRDDAARCMDTIKELEKRGAELAENVRHAERVNMRLFQCLERADTIEQVDEVRRVFEAESGMVLETEQPAAYTKRTIDKTKPYIRLEDASSRILRVNLSGHV